MTELLVVGYGNELRGDDAAGPHVARAVAGWGLAGVEVLVAHQLTPELAEPLSRAGRVVFVDAGLTGAFVELSGRPETPAFGHFSDPRYLLELARVLYGRRPPAWMLTVAGNDFAVGEGVSSEAEQGIALALAQIRRLATEPPVT